MIYEYFCSNCAVTTEITKTLAELNRQELCNDCDNSMVRHLTGKVGFSGEKTDSHNSYFHHGLGKMVRSDKHASQMAKDQGLIELGNETQNHLRPNEKRYDLTDGDYHDVMGAGVIRGT